MMAFTASAAAAMAVSAGCGNDLGGREALMMASRRGGRGQAYIWLRKGDRLLHNLQLGSVDMEVDVAAATANVEAEAVAWVPVAAATAAMAAATAAVMLTALVSAAAVPPAAVAVTAMSEGPQRRHP